VSTAIKWLEDMGYGVDGKFDLAAKRMWHGYEIKEILELYAAGFPQSGRTEPAEPTSGEPPQTWIEAWADKVLGKGNRPCGWPNFGSIGIKEVALMLEAYASECVKRERERCAGIVLKHAKTGKVDRVDWLCEQIRAAIERGEG